MKRFYLFAAFTAMLLLNYASVQAQSCQALFQASTTPTGFFYTFMDSSYASSGNVNSWLWDFGDGNTSTQQNPVHAYNAPGTYLVCLTITTTQPCTSVFCDSIVVGNSGPNCTANLTASVSGNTATFTATGSGTGTPVSWYWDFGDGNATSTSTPTTSHTYVGGGTTGNYNACVTISYSDSCDATSCQNVTIGGSSSNCQAYFNASTTPAGFFYTFSDSSVASGGSVNSWMWDFGDGNTSTQQNPAHTYNAPGTYLVCLTITTTQSCTSTYCDSIVVGNSGPNCTASLSSTVAGSTATFIASGTGSGTPVSWFWDFGDGNTSTTSNPMTSHTYTVGGTSGNFNACVTISYSDSCVATSCQNVSIGGSNPNCLASFYHFPDTSTAYSIIVVNTSSPNNGSCLWDFGDGNTSTNCYPTHTYSGPGTYVLCLTVSTPLCTSTYCDSIVVVSKVNAPFSINVVPDSPTSLQNPQAQDLAVEMYPNPASDFVNISAQMAVAGNLEIDIYDLQGNQVRHFSENGLSVGGHSFRLQTAELPAGIYLARVRSGKQMVTKKLLLTK